MLYPRCPTCRTILANKQIPYEIRLEKICKDLSKSFDQKEQDKRKLLDELYIINECCRMRFLGYVRLIDTIK